MWRDAVAAEAFRAAVAGAGEIRSDTLRLFGIPESEIAATLNRVAADGVDLDRLEITTCLRRGEIEIVTRYPPDAAPVYEQLVQAVRERHADTLFAEDDRTIDELVAQLLRDRGETVAVAESCTGGLLGGRLTDLAGSSDYFVGGLLVYSNEAKVALAGVDPAVIEGVGAVSQEVAEALADGARSRLGASIGIGVTGVAGPGGGTEDKPVGTVWVSVSGTGDRRITRSVMLPGGRADIRDRTTVVALHLLRRLLLAS
jgi:nicotinamide-nucleotide amidase